MRGHKLERYGIGNDFKCKSCGIIFYIYGESVLISYYNGGRIRSYEKYLEMNCNEIIMRQII